MATGFFVHGKQFIFHKYKKEVYVQTTTEAVQTVSHSFHCLTHVQVGTLETNSVLFSKKKKKRTIN